MPADEEAIREVVANWGKASADGDIPNLLTLMSEDVVFLTPGREPMLLKDFVEGTTKMRDTHRLGVVADIKDIKVSGDLAYAWSHLSVTIMPLQEGAPVAVRSGYAMSVFHKQANGKWVLIRDANLMV
jgi:uncharacterized protein (TIGR02246 family)